MRIVNCLGVIDFSKHRNSVKLYQSVIDNYFKLYSEKNSKKSKCDKVKALSPKELFNYFVDTGSKPSLKELVGGENDEEKVINIYEDADDIQADIQASDFLDSQSPDKEVSKVVGKEEARNIVSNVDDREKQPQGQVKEENLNIGASETKQQ